MNFPLTSRRIMVFDSGLGGLSILQGLMAKMPELSYTYVADHAFFPYGQKADAQIRRRLLSLIPRLLQDFPAHLLVLACNTASTIALNELRAVCHLPIVGVVPAIKPAAKITRSGVIGILATEATIKRQYTAELLQSFAPHCQSLLVGSSELVILAEAKLYGQAPAREKLYEELKPLLDHKPIPDTLVLACTHFPLLKKEIANFFPTSTQCIDSTAAIAERVFALLAAEGPREPGEEKAGVHHIFLSTSLEPKSLTFTNSLALTLGFSFHTASLYSF